MTASMPPRIFLVVIDVRVQTAVAPFELAEADLELGRPRKTLSIGMQWLWKIG